MKTVNDILESGKDSDLIIIGLFESPISTFKVIGNIYENPELL